MLSSLTPLRRALHSAYTALAAAFVVRGRFGFGRFRECSDVLSSGVSRIPRARSVVARTLSAALLLVLLLLFLLRCFVPASLLVGGTGRPRACPGEIRWWRWT